MRRIVGPASIDVPDELVDRTSYAFEARASVIDPDELPPKPDRVLLTWEELPESVTPEMLVAHRRARIEEFSGVTSTITEGQIVGPVVLASALQADVDAGDERFTVLFAAFRWSNSRVGSIQFDAVTRKNARAEFAHITASLRPAGSPQPAATGFVQRYAGDVALDLPAGFRWPKTYLFVTDDEGARLMITTDEAEPGPIDFDAFVEVEGVGDELHVETIEQRDVPLGIGARGEEADFRVERRDASGAVLEAKIIRRVVALTKDRAWLSILLFEDAAAPAIGEAGFSAMVQSLLPSGQIP